MALLSPAVIRSTPTRWPLPSRRPLTQTRQERLPDDVNREGLDGRTTSTPSPSTSRTPVPTKQITDLLQFISVIDPAGIDSVETKPAGTGAFTLVERKLGQSIEMKANPQLLAEGSARRRQASTSTVFSDADAASAALELGAVDMIYGANQRDAARQQDEGYQLIQGPGPLVQVFRINATRPTLQQREIPAGIQLPDQSRRDPQGGLCQHRRSHCLAVGAGKPGLRCLVQREVRL